MSTPGAPVAGWYPDPYDPAQLRYWDGVGWSEATAPAAAPAEPGPGPSYGAAGYGAPGYGAPGYGAAGYGAPGYGTGYGTPGPQGGSGLGEIGGWLGDTFKVLVARILPISALLLVIPAAASVVATVAAWSAVANLTIDTTGDDVVTSGFNAGPLVVAVLAVAVSTLLWFYCWLAANHQLYYAHAGQPVSLGRSLAAALRHLPKALVMGVLLGLVAMVAIGLLYGIPVGLAIANDDPVWLGLLVILAPVLFGLVLWLGVRLYHLLMVLSVAPRGTKALGTALRLTKGRWLAHFGRLLVLMAVVYGISFVFGFAINILFQTAFLTTYDTNQVTGELQINGRDVSTIDVFVVRDFLPALPLLVALSLLYAVNSAVSQALMASGAAGLYHRAGGPAEAIDR